MPTWREWRTTVSQRSLEIIIHGEWAVEADRRNAGKKVSTQLTCPKLWKNSCQSMEKIKKKKKNCYEITNKPVKVVV
jgi:D-tyrosyl-tRNA(Tyr) deacylase